MDIRKIIANNIKAERIRAGYTQEETAEKLGITRRTYMNYEKGYKIDAYYILKLSQIFNCKMDNFYMGLNNTNCD